jgi:hypothetical protein
MFIPYFIDAFPEVIEIRCFVWIDSRGLFDRSKSTENDLSTSQQHRKVSGAQQFDSVDDPIQANPTDRDRVDRASDSQRSSVNLCGKFLQVGDAALTFVIS